MHLRGAIHRPSPWSDGVETTALLDYFGRAYLVDSGGRSLANLSSVRDKAQQQFTSGVAVGHDPGIETMRPQPCGGTIDSMRVAHEREFLVDRQPHDRRVLCHCHFDLLDLESGALTGGDESCDREPEGLVATVATIRSRPCRFGSALYAEYVHRYRGNVVVATIPRNIVNVYSIVSAESGDGRL